MAFTKITDEDLIDKGVIGLPDVPSLPTMSMQEKFEETAREVIIPNHNKLVEELEEKTAASNIGSTNGNVQKDIDDLGKRIFESGTKVDKFVDEVTKTSEALAVLKSKEEADINTLDSKFTREDTELSNRINTVATRVSTVERATTSNTAKLMKLTRG